MKMDSRDYERMLAYLDEQASQGNRFIAFPDEETPIGTDALSAFPTGYEAKEYCYEMSTDLDSYKFLPMHEVQLLLKDGLKDVDLTAETSRIIDVTERLEQLNKQILLHRLNNKDMNEENFDYLKNQVKFTGFGDGLENQLKEAIKKGEPQFTLQHQATYGKDEVNATLHFRRSDEKDMCFFNKYDLSLKKDGAQERKQTFFIGKENNFTFKEAYNLLDGRSVNKDLVNKQGEKYNSWVKLDFNDADAKGNFKVKHFHENYGFNLPDALSKHDLKELKDETNKERLIESLKKGNRQSITYMHDGEERKGFVQANPQYKSIKLFDEKEKEVRLTEKQAEKQDQSSAKKQDVKQDDEDSPKKNAAKSKKRGTRVS